VATHDYVIANGTGAAVRSDLNDALAAIVSQNSSASEPATMYAYMLWADTTAGIMKMRNGANSAWISLWELDGTFIATDISLSAGTAGAPSLYFTGDTNTGIYSPGADQVAISTGGSGRLFVNSSGNIGMGTNALINNAGYTTLYLNGSTGGSIGFKTGDVIKQYIYSTGTTLNYSGNGGDSHIFYCNTEKMRLTSTGLGIGVTSVSQRLHVGDSAGNPRLRIESYSGSQNAGVEIGSVRYDVSTSKAEMRLYTDNGSGLQTAVTIDSAQRVGIGVTSPSALLHVSGGNGTTFKLDAPNDYSSTASILMTQGRSEIRTTIAASGGNPGGSLFFRTRNNAGSLVDALTIDYNQTVTINSAAGTSPLIVGDGGIEAMRVDSAGRLLVGTSSALSNIASATPQQQIITAVNTSDTGLALINYSAAGVEPKLTLGISQSATKGTNALLTSGNRMGAIDFAGNDGTNFIIGAKIEASLDGTSGTNDMPGKLVFSTTADGAATPTERVRINSVGYFLASNTGSHAFPNSLLHQFRSNESAFRSLMVENTNNTSGNGTYNSILGTNCNNTSSYHFVGNTGTTDRVLIYGNGNIQNSNGSYTTISDVKLKENIVDAGSQWDDFKAIQIRNWNFKEETGHETHRQIGPIAQELETVCPGLVFETPDRDEDGNETGEVTKGVNQSVLYMKAVKALQEAMERIEQLETEMAAVKAQLS
jgi:hypothetical protein